MPRHVKHSGKQYGAGDGRQALLAGEVGTTWTLDGTSTLPSSHTPTFHPMKPSMTTCPA